MCSYKETETRRWTEKLIKCIYMGLSEAFKALTQCNINPIVPMKNQLQERFSDFPQNQTVAESS